MDFQMNSENIETNAKQIPTFAFMGQFASSNCCLDEPFDGFLTCILQPDMEIKSIESQLRRVETYNGKTASTEI